MNKPGRDPTGRGLLDKPKTETDEPDAQAEDGQAPEAGRYPRVRRGGRGESLDRPADSARAPLNTVGIFDDRVVDESSDVRARDVAEGVPPRTPLEQFALCQAVAPF